MLKKSDLIMNIIYPKFSIIKSALDLIMGSNETKGLISK